MQLHYSRPSNSEQCLFCIFIRKISKQVPFFCIIQQISLYAARRSPIQQPPRRLNSVFFCKNQRNIQSLQSLHRCSSPTEENPGCPVRKNPSSPTEENPSYPFKRKINLSITEKNRTALSEKIHAILPEKNQTVPARKPTLAPPPTKKSRLLPSPQQVLSETRQKHDRCQAFCKRPAPLPFFDNLKVIVRKYQKLCDTIDSDGAGRKNPYFPRTPQGKISNVRGKIKTACSKALDCPADSQLRPLHDEAGQKFHHGSK